MASVKEFGLFFSRPLVYFHNDSCVTVNGPEVEMFLKAQYHLRKGGRAWTYGDGCHLSVRNAVDLF